MKRLKLKILFKRLTTPADKSEKDKNLIITEF